MGSQRDGIDDPLPFHAAGALLGALSGEDAAEFGPVDPTLPSIGDYHIDRRLGAGGSGVVYHAVRRGWGEEYAIKLLHRPVGDGLSARRALRELDVVERLSLPSLPRVYDYDIHADGRLFIVSEFVDGLPLDEYCAAHDLDRRERVKLLVRVGRVLHQLHQHGVIHRDVKPGNVLVTPDGHPRLIDLGIAALITEDPFDTWADDQGPVGSPAFMAPEQARGEPAATALPVDIYGLGSTACYLLTGQTPHVRADTLFESIRRVGTEPPRRARELDPDLPPGLAAVLDHAIAADPAKRFHSAGAMADDLERWLRGMPVLSQPPSWWRNRWLSVRRHPARWAWGTAAAVVILGLATGAVAVRAKHVNDRLALLAELEAKQGELVAKQDELDESIRIMNDGLRRFTDQMIHLSGKPLIGGLALHDAYVASGSLDPEDPLSLELERGRDEIVRDGLAELYSVEMLELPPEALMRNVARAVYGPDGLTDAELRNIEDYFREMARHDDGDR